MKTWTQLEARAKRRKLGLYNQGDRGVLRRATGDRALLVSGPGEALTGDDRDQIACAAIEAVIREVSL